MTDKRGTETQASGSTSNGSRYTVGGTVGETDFYGKVVMMNNSLSEYAQTNGGSGSKQMQTAFFEMGNDSNISRYSISIDQKVDYATMNTTLKYQPRLTSWKLPLTGSPDFDSYQRIVNDQNNNPTFNTIEEADRYIRGQISKLNKMKIR